MAGVMALAFLLTLRWLPRGRVELAQEQAPGGVPALSEAEF
jgi:hypothetical protein